MGTSTQYIQQSRDLKWKWPKWLFVTFLTLLFIGWAITTIRPLYMAKVKGTAIGGFGNANQQAGETKSAMLILTFRNMDAQCRADLQHNTTMPSLSNLFNKPCNEFTLEDVASWLENALDAPRKWVGRVLKEGTGDVARLIRLALRTAQ